jgi:mono/diheme cytochrome c family protein
VDKRKLQEVAVSKTLQIVSLMLFAGFCAQAQQTQPAPKPAPVVPYIIPDDAVHQPNPVKPTPESVAQGKKWYGYDCAMCHGKDGDGKGDVGTDMKLKVSDFTDPATLKGRTDGEIFYIIKFGKAEMPPEGTRVKGNELWDLVNYVRSFAKKKDSPEEKAAR